MFKRESKKTSWEPPGKIFKNPGNSNLSVHVITGVFYLFNFIRSTLVFDSMEHSPLQRVADVISFLHQRRQQIRRTGICLDIARFRVTQNALRDGHVILF